MSKQLRDFLLDHLDPGEPMSALTVLTDENDPFRLDTPANHAMAVFERDLLANHRVTGCTSAAPTTSPSAASPRPVGKGVRRRRLRQR